MYIALLLDIKRVWLPSYAGKILLQNHTQALKIMGCCTIWSVCHWHLCLMWGLALEVDTDRNHILPWKVIKGVASGGIGWWSDQRARNILCWAKGWDGPVVGVADREWTAWWERVWRMENVHAMSGFACKMRCCVLVWWIMWLWIGRVLVCCDRICWVTCMMERNPIFGSVSSQMNNTQVEHDTLFYDLMHARRVDLDNDIHQKHEALKVLHRYGVKLIKKSKFVPRSKTTSSHAIYW